MKELADLAMELDRNQIPLGQLHRTFCGGQQEEFLTDGIDHQLGFIRYKDPDRIVLGIRGGGCCGYDLVVSPDGAIIKNPLSMAYGRWTTENARSDYFSKCHKFLTKFDDFYQRVLNYVDNL